MRKDKKEHNEIDINALKEEIYNEIVSYINEQLEYISTELTSKVTLFISSLMDNLEKKLSGTLSDLPELVSDAIEDIKNVVEEMRKRLNDTIRRVNLLQNFINEHIIRAISDLRERIIEVDKNVKLLESKVSRIQAQMKAQPTTVQQPAAPKEPKAPAAKPTEPAKVPTTAPAKQQLEPKTIMKPQETPTPVKTAPTPSPRDELANKVAEILKPTTIETPKPIEEKELSEVQEKPIRDPNQLRLALAARLTQLFSSMKKEDEE